MISTDMAVAKKFPLTRRKDGRWQKMVKGRLYYFTGSKQVALEQWTRTARGMSVFVMTDGRDESLKGIRCLRHFDDGEIRLKHLTMLPPTKHPSGVPYEWVVEPWHGVQKVFNVAEIGLIPADVKTTFSRARARPFITYQTDHTEPKNRSTVGVNRSPSDRHGDPSKVSVAMSATGAEERVGRLLSEILADLPYLQPVDATRVEIDANVTVAQPLFDAAGNLIQESFDELLGWTIPTAYGQRETGIWNFARQLKSLPDTRSLPTDVLKPIVNRWWELALPRIRTKDWFETWGAFSRAWERAVPFGGGSRELNEIIDLARRAGCPPELRPEFGTHTCGLVAAICRELALRGGDFWLSSRALAHAIGVGQPTATGYINALIGSRVIRRIADPVYRKSATVYRYLRPLPLRHARRSKKGAGT